uniref:EOG090X0ARU n=1 Tax=Eubosmina coregoni TaxID=186181 RepID=A0A4Y7LLH6_9CRUS|nr:EOG090X0ARU [Eubosmina coregoni]SVE69977.1 EOG090X0ARU [Eubosmina coregoni]
MFKRKLQALGYPNPDVFNSSDEKHFRNIVIWLEDQKVRRYKIEERESLRNSSENDWDAMLKQYLADLDCPYSQASRPEILDWLLSLSVHLEFSEKAAIYKGESQSQQGQTVSNINPLENLDFTSDDFKTGVYQLADHLKVPRHPDHLITLEAVASLITEKFNAETIKDASTKFPSKGTPIDFTSLDFGLNIKESNLSQAAKSLRYLFIHDMRGLQTKINECLVAVQSLTANPKTDSKLGKVGF